MGLGLFIAKTLLERTGARVTFGNAAAPGGRRGRTHGGAQASVVWPLASIAAPESGALGENTPFLP